MQEVATPLLYGDRVEKTYPVFAFSFAIIRPVGRKNREHLNVLFIQSLVSQDCNTQAEIARF